MPGFDVDKFKRALSAAAEKQSEYLNQRGRPSELSQRARNRRDVGGLLKSSLTKAGVDVGKLDELLAQQQSGLRQLFKEQNAKVAKSAVVEKDPSRLAIDMVRHASKRPADALPATGLSSLVALPEPFLIWEWPHASPDQLRDTHIEQFQSTAKILIDIPAYSFDDDSGSDEREFSFYFLWQNETDFLAVLNCFSVLNLTGACEVAANAGIFSGDTMSLTIDASLFPIAYWLQLQPGQTIRDLRIRGDALQTQRVLDLSATGGHIFGDAATASRTFTHQDFGLSFHGFGGVQVPARATALFEVSLAISYRWDGNTLPDEIIADFANQPAFNVKCPIVVVQLLTAPAAVALTGSEHERAGLV